MELIFERRSARTEVRATSKKNVMRLEGYAATFNQITQLPKFRERIMPGAFTRSIHQASDVVCLFNHDANVVLGRSKAGTLRLSQDSRGLHYECSLPNTHAAHDIYASIQRGDINGSSFAFAKPTEDQEDWTEEEDRSGKFLLRTLKDLTLRDVSPVTYPAYSDTSVDARFNVVCQEVRKRQDHKRQPAVLSPVYGLQYRSDCERFGLPVGTTSYEELIEAEQQSLRRRRNSINFLLL